MLVLQNISYIHPNKNLLFDKVNLTVNKYDKTALIGNNGAGKSTLLKIIAGESEPSGGKLFVEGNSYYVPQIFGQFNHLTIAEALRAAVKLNALKAILKGNATGENLNLLEDDWTIEERCQKALNYWQLHDLSLELKMGTLSGGQKTKVLLSGISIHQPDFVLMDEPSNHLDTAGRELLYDFVRSTSSTLLIASHDRKLLDMVDTVSELSSHGITVYGGNYGFYAEQKQVESKALAQDIKSTEKALQKAREKEREMLERQQKLDARGKKKQKKAGVARIMMNTLKNSAERSTSKAMGMHTEKINGISHALRELRAGVPGIDEMKFGFDHSALHKGKTLFAATGINYGYGHRLLWKENLSFQVTSGERISLEGLNGSGKTTLINLILGNLEPQTGTCFRAGNRSVYIDQDYSWIDNRLRVYEQAQQINIGSLKEHEIKIRLNRFLFPKEVWDKSCGTLSGGERMRLMLCCLTISNQAPDIIVLDEPTNNLDIQNVEILTAAINEYQGTLIVVSHDDYFLEQVNIARRIRLQKQ